VTIRIARSEMGQGSLTGLAQLVAEELECDWARVGTEFASPNEHVKRKRVWGSMSTGGSAGIRTSQEYLRKAGASAREMLVAAAADQWQVAAAECTVDKGVISHAPSKRRVSYGKVAAAGTVDDRAIAQLMRAPFFRGKPPKTAGREEFGREFVSRFVRLCGRTRKENVVATATAFTARSIADGVRRFVLRRGSFQEMVASGGGTKNPILMAMLANELRPLGLEVRSSDEFGLPSEAKEAAVAPAAGLPIVINLFEGDESGSFRQQLEAVGAALGEYDPALQFYRAVATWPTIEKIAALDFVLFVEPIELTSPAHDQSTPLIDADMIRPGISFGLTRFSGSSIPVGILDSGFAVSHQDFTNKNFCGINYTNEAGAFDDLLGHVVCDFHFANSTGQDEQRPVLRLGRSERTGPRDEHRDHHQDRAD
jgi:hypothetical protein